MSDANPATGQDIELWQGNSRLVSIRVAKPDGSPIDLTSCVARWWLGRSNKAKGSDVFVMKSSTDGSITLALGLDGFWRATFTLEPDDTENLSTPANLYHELEIVDGQGDVTTGMTGKLKLVPTIIPPSLDVA